MQFSQFNRKSFDTLQLLTENMLRIILSTLSNEYGKESFFTQHAAPVLWKYSCSQIMTNPLKMGYSALCGVSRRLCTVCRPSEKQEGVQRVHCNRVRGLGYDIRGLETDKTELPLLVIVKLVENRTHSTHTQPFLFGEHIRKGPGDFLCISMQHSCQRLWLRGLGVLTFRWMASFDVFFFVSVPVFSLILITFVVRVNSQSIPTLTFAIFCYFRLIVCQWPTVLRSFVSLIVIRSLSLVAF